MVDLARVRLVDLVRCVARAIDLVTPRVADHHRRVAYLAAAIADEVGLGPEERTDIVLAAAMHDVGALSLRDRLATLEFEVKQAELHCERGFRLLGGFAPFQKAGRLVRHHHHRWSRRDQAQGVPRGAFVIHLADRADILVDRNAGVLGQVPLVMGQLRNAVGDLLAPDLFEAFESVAEQEAFWLALSDSRALDDVLANVGPSAGELEVDGPEILRLSELLSRIIDFRSRFTAVHSAGVAAVAGSLGQLAGFDDRDVQHLQLAGFLHDLGKLAVPTEIIDKPATLDASERGIMRSHTYYTHQVLSEVPALDRIRLWAALHHERLDGSGYPFRARGDAIPPGSRIVSVADVFTALTEDRPYRAALPLPEALALMQEMVERSALDADLVGLVASSAAALDGTRLEAQQVGRAFYGAFAAEVPYCSGTILSA